MNKTYNTEVYFNSIQYKKLLRYKRILGARILNGEYPSSSIDVQDIITQTTLLIKK